VGEIQIISKADAASTSRIIASAGLSTLDSGVEETVFGC
jgi:hypothetical protein